MIMLLKGRRSARHAEPEATHQRGVPTPGRLPTRKANKNAAELSSKRYGFKRAPWLSS